MCSCTFNRPVTSKATIGSTLLLGVAPATASPLPDWPAGMPAPAFSATTTEGETVSRETILGTVTVLDFVATNCPFSRRQVRDIERVRRRYAGDGCRFILVNQVMRNKEPTSAQVKDTFRMQLGFAGDLVIDNDNLIGRPFHVRAYPTMVIVDNNGKIHRVIIGAVANLAEQLSAALDDLDVPQTKPQTPSFRMMTVDGKEVSNATVRNAVTVLAFVAPDQEHWRGHVAWVERTRRQYDSDDCRIVLVTLPQEKEALNRTQLRATIQTQLGFKGELILDDHGTAAKAFLAYRSGSVVVLGRCGRIERELLDTTVDLTAQLKAVLEALGVPSRIPADDTAAPQRP